MKMNASVRIRKLAAADNPVVRTPSDDVYIPGRENPGLSLPIAYEIEGELLRDVVVGEAIAAYRRKRNGVEIPGVFETSVVQSIEEQSDRTVVKTSNSVYEVIEISPPVEGIPV